MTRAIAAALVLAASGCYDGPTSDSSVFDCYCTGEIARMLNTALDIATIQDDALRDELRAWTTDELDSRMAGRVDPSFYWLDARILELEARIRELEAACPASAADSSPDP
jgi:hypothetical protein